MPDRRASPVASITLVAGSVDHGRPRVRPVVVAIAMEGRQNEGSGLQRFRWHNLIERIRFRGLWLIMSSLKSRLQRAAARLMGTAPQSVPVPYELTCACGYRVAGIRRPAAIMATCNGCGGSLYVSPVNVYPATRRVRSEVLDGSLANRVSTVVKELIVPESPPETGTRMSDRSHSDEPADAVTRDRRRAASETGRPRSNDDDARRAASVAALPEFLEPIPESAIVVPKIAFSTRLKRLLTPVRLLGVASLVIVLVTAWYMVRQQQFESARRIWRQEMDLVDTAIKNGDPSPLRASLTKAVAAAERLGRTDSEVRRARSLLQQTESLEQLSNYDLVDRLSTASPASSGAYDPASVDLSAAQSKADSLRGEVFLFDGPIRVVEADTSLVQADLGLIVGGVPVRIQFPSATFVRLAAVAGTQPVLFAGRIAECRAEPGPPLMWRITLDADSCCLVTTMLHAGLAGFTPENTPGLGAILERQAEFLSRAEADTARQSTPTSTPSAEREPGA